MDDTADFKFNLALQDYDQFIDDMSEIFPTLARWVDPKATAKPTFLPILDAGGNAIFSKNRVFCQTLVSARQKTPYF